MKKPALKSDDEISLDASSDAGNLPTNEQNLDATGKSQTGEQAGLHQPRGNGLPAPPDSLESAATFIGRNARTVGDEPFELRSRAAIAQREALVVWARERRLMATPSLWAGKAITGASEHDVWPEHGEYWKVTRPDHFGWTVLPGDDGRPEAAEATPLEYLDRWINHNRFFGDSAILRAVVKTEEGVQVVISHPHVDGPYPTQKAIIRDMKSRGFEVVPGFTIGAGAPSFYMPGENLAVFDASKDNFILSGGVPVPVDVIALMPGQKLRAQLLRLIHAGRPAR